MHPMILREYDRLRAKDWSAADAMRAARTYYNFWRREAGEHDEPDAMHCVRLRMEPDECSDFDDLCGDSYNPTVNPDIPQDQLERERAEFLERCNNDGVWGVIGEFWNEVTRAWELAGSCWGFVGDEWKDSGTDADIMRAALAARTQSVRMWRNMRKAAP